MKWAIDSSHSSVTFSIRHMMSKVRGEMKVKEGWIETRDSDLGSAKVEVVLDANSIDTGVEPRDNHLRSADGMFDVANYPTVSFRSRRVEGADPADFKVIGDLTIHGVTRPVTLKASFHGQGKDPWGNQRAGFSAQAKLNRKDFNLTWNQALESGGFLVGDDVNVEIDTEAVAAPSEAQAGRQIETAAAAESR